MAAASAGAWAALSLGTSAFWAVLLASKLAALTAACLAWRRPPLQDLAWDGRQWLLGGRPARVQLMLDLGPWMLLLARRQGAAPGTSQKVWVPLAASEAGAAWGALRAAIYARPVRTQPVPDAPERQTS